MSTFGSDWKHTAWKTKTKQKNRNILRFNRLLLASFRRRLRSKERWVSFSCSLLIEDSRKSLNWLQEEHRCVTLFLSIVFLFIENKCRYRLLCSVFRDIQVYRVFDPTWALCWLHCHVLFHCVVQVENVGWNRRRADDRDEVTQLTTPLSVLD